jgi:hypothetical protein
MALRRGWGRGRGWRRPWNGPVEGPWDYAAPAPEAGPEYERVALKAQANWLQEQLDIIRTRMDELNEPSGETE